MLLIYSTNANGKYINDQNIYFLIIPINTYFIFAKSIVLQLSKFIFSANEYPAHKKKNGTHACIIDAVTKTAVFSSKLFSTFV